MRLGNQASCATKSEWQTGLFGAAELAGSLLGAFFLTAIGLDLYPKSSTFCRGVNSNQVLRALGTERGMTK